MSGHVQDRSGSGYGHGARARVNAVMNLQVPYNAENLLTS